MGKRLISFIMTMLMIVSCVTLSVHAAEPKSWSLESPGKNISVSIKLSETGTVTYSTKLNGKDMILDSALGINVTGYANFTAGLEYVSETSKKIDETYDMISGKFSTYINKAEELIITFAKDGKEIKFVFRAYDDGMAFRYVIEGTGSYTAGTTSDTGEITEVKLTPGSNVFAMPYSAVYETNYRTYTLSQLLNTNVGMPMLVKTANGDWMTFAQADLNSTYCGAMLRGADDNGLLRVRLSTNQTSAVNITLPFKSPWRTAVIGTPKIIAESMMFENLCEPNKLEDTSWIKSGITDWSWLNGDPCDSGETYKEYIDFAKEIGWDYCLMDAGWQVGETNNQYRDWTDELMAYSKANGIGLWAWANYALLNTREKCETVLKDWAEKGVVGIKVDYFNNESQARLAIYDYITEIAAKYKLMVNYHGSNLPSGERRTWPHLLGREGIRGAEQKGNLAEPAYQNTLLSFMRNLVGPMDYTPVLSPSWNSNRLTTAHNVGFAVVVECGINSYADKPDAYRASPAYDFFRNIPAAWDESVLLDGIPGEYVVMGRRSGDNWYVGAVTDAAKTVSLPMSFLGEGTYYASVYTDGATLNDVNIELEEITKNDVIVLPMSLHGGAGIKITKTAPKMPSDISIGDKIITLPTGVTRSISAKVIPADSVIPALTWTSADTSIATVSNGLVTAVAPGNTTVTAETANGIKKSVDISVYQGLSIGPQWFIRKPEPAKILGLESDTKLLMEGDAGDIYGSGGDVNNIFLTELPNGDYSFQTKLTFTASSNYHAAGLTVFLNDDNYMALLRRYHSSFGGKCIQFVNESNGSCTENNQIADNFNDTIYLKIDKVGTNYTGYVSNDGQTWTTVTSRTNANVTNNADSKIGFLSKRASGRSVIWEDFTVNGTIIPYSGAKQYPVYMLINPPVNNPQAGKSFTVAPKIYNTTDEQKAVHTYLTAFDEEGTELGTISEVKILPAKENSAIALTLAVPVNAAIVKMFVCDAEKNNFIPPVIWEAVPPPPSVWSLESPSENISVSINLSDAGAVTYSTTVDGRPVILDSALGINITGYADFTTGLVFKSAATNKIDETYDMLSGKFSTYVNKAEELILTFEKDGKEIKFVFRAYDDGMAFRYVIEGTGSYTAGTTSATGEITEVKLTPGSDVFAMPYSAVYETNYRTYTLSQLLNTNIGMPMLVKTADGDWMTFAQAELNSTYCGVMLRGADDNGLLRVRLSTNQTSAVNITLPFKSPWRTAVIGTPKVIAESMMFENLCEPNKLEDTSWIKSGITDWSWLNGDPCNDGETYKKYIDFAKEIGWDYCLMDAGWQVAETTNQYRDWTDELMAYSKANGIGLWAWANYALLNTREKCETVLKDWAEKGVVGIKVDYFNNESQARLAIYDYITEIAAKYKLMVNYHGSNLPSGERRTWPHLLGREGIRGAEQKGNLAEPAYQNTLLSFMRNLVGPMDYTPVLAPSWNSNRQTTAHNVGFAVVVECGINSYADKPDAYRISPAYDFFRNIPAAWDESVLLDGIPGEYVVMGRRSGDNWYVGAVTDLEKDVDLPMSFLGEGTYYATIYRDGATINDITVESIEITKDDVISLPMKLHGGAAIKITKEKPVEGEKLPKPTGVKAVVSANQANITVSWDPVANADEISRYIVYFGFTPDFEINAGNRTGIYDNTATSIVFSPDARATFYFKVVVLAKNGTFSDPSDVAGPASAGLKNYCREAVRVWANFNQNNNERDELACDGSYTTKWCATGITAANERGFLFVKLVDDDEKPREIHQFKVAHGGVNESASYNTRNFDIDYSMDGINWINVVQCRNNADSRTAHDLDEPIYARYVRLNVINGEQGSSNTARIYEFMALGLKDATIKPVASNAKIIITPQADNDYSVEAQYTFSSINPYVVDGATKFEWFEKINGVYKPMEYNDVSMILSSQRLANASGLKCVITPVDSFGIEGNPVTAELSFYTRVFNVDNTVINTLAQAAGQTVTASVSVKNFAESKDIAVYVALYDANGRLADIKYQNAVLSSAEELVSLTIDVPAVTTGMKLKIFVWSDDYIPIIDVYSIE